MRGRLSTLLRSGAGLLLGCRSGLLLRGRPELLLGCRPRLLLRLRAWLLLGFRTRSRSGAGLLLGRGPSLGCRSVLGLRRGPCLRLRRGPGLGLRSRTGLGCGAGLRLRNGAGLRLRCRPGFRTCTVAWLARAAGLDRGLTGALRVAGLARCGTGGLDRGLAGALLVAGLAGSGARFGRRTAFISGLAGALLVSRLTWTLTAVGGASHVLARDLGLLLFAGDCRRGRGDGTSGGDGAGHGDFSRAAAVGGVELLLVLGRGLSYLTLLGQRLGTVLAAGS